MSKIVWVNGCFDVLHRGHFELFKFAKSFGDRLIVGIDSDAKVKKTKGEDRPINNEEDRRFMLECNKHIDAVVIFDSANELERYIKLLEPIMVIGSDWKGKTVVGEKYAKDVLFFDRIGNYSTTNLLRRIDG